MIDNVGMDAPTIFGHSAIHDVLQGRNDLIDGGCRKHFSNVFILGEEVMVEDAQVTAIENVFG